MVVAVHIVAPLRVDVGIQKSTYFKVNPPILKNKDNLLELEISWKATEIVEQDPRRHFSFSFERT